MTPKEAIDLLIMAQEKPRNCGCEMYVALDMSINALVKQIPKKPTGTLEDILWGVGKCPSCGKQFCTEARKSAKVIRPTA